MKYQLVGHYNEYALHIIGQPLSYHKARAEAARLMAEDAALPGPRAHLTIHMMAIVETWKYQSKKGAKRRART